MYATGQFKYKNIAELIRQKIINGKYKPGQYLPPGKELARMFDTTRVTIDKAIALLVSDGLVSRTPGVGTIIEKERKTNSISMASSRVVGALMERKTVSLHWNQLLDGVEDVLEVEGYSNLVRFHNAERDLVFEHAQYFKNYGVEILLFLPLDMDTPEEYESVNAGIISELRSMGFEVIMLDRYIESLPGHYVTEYSFSQVKEMIANLFNQGFSNPLLISTEYVSVVGNRERAFMEECRKNGISDPASRIIRLNKEVFRSHNYDTIVSEISAAGSYDVLLSINSLIFNNIIYLNTRGDLHVNDGPVPLSGFVDLELMDLANVVSYVDQPIRAIGQAAGALVKNIISNQAVDYMAIHVPCELRIL